MKRNFVLLASLICVIATMAPGTSRADVDTLHGKVTINCQIELPIFPAPENTSAFPHKCGGGGTAVLTGQPDNSNKDMHWVAACAWTSQDKKPGEKDGTSNNCPTDGGFNAYNIIYSEVCVPPAPLPPIGTANGDAWMNLTSVPNGQHGVLVFHFTYQRTGNGAVITITNASIQNISWRVNGDRPVPNGSTPGTAQGNFALKPLQAFGTCLAPAPTTVIITADGKLGNPV